MKISKYPQACFIAETKGQKILLDPGYLKYEDSFFNEWSECPAILITHSHKDHIHEEVVAKLIKNGSALYTSKEVSNVYPSLKANIVKEGDNFNVGDIKVETVGAVHGYLHRFRESNMVIDENIGFIIDDGETRVYHTSDCIGFKNDYKCDVLLAPVIGHGITFDSYSAADYAQATDAKLTIACHYDHSSHPVDMDVLKSEFKSADKELKIMEIGESLGI